jgi:hypothetical protein
MSNDVQHVRRNWAVDAAIGEHEGQTTAGVRQ